MDSDIQENRLFLWFKKHIIIILVLIILIVVSLIIFLPTSDNVKFELYGNSEVTVYKDGQYYEYGYFLDNKNEYTVQVISAVDTTKIGSYMIKYRLLTKDGQFKLEKVRRVNVIEDPLKNVTLMLNGENAEYVLLNSEYNEKGAKAIYNGNDISTNIIISGNVNTKVVGNYEVKYTIKVENREKTISRFVRVFEMIFESEVNYQKKAIDINVATPDFDYVLLPNGEKRSEESFLYTYIKSGTYKFTIYTKNGFSNTYEVKVLDHEKPFGTCEAKINGSVTEVTITATDDDGINRYTYGNLSFNTNKFTINEKLSTFMIRVYDNSDNYIDVECRTRRLFNNNMDEIKLSTTLTPCHSDWSKYNSELANLVLEYGPKSRDAVAASAEYLAKFPFKVAYYWGGKGKTPGINYEWGCWKEGFTTSSGSYICTEQKGTQCINGMDCTGYTAWAYINAGFDPGIIRTSGQSEGMWGNFNARKHRYTFRGNQDKVNLIKPGDIVHNPGHVGIVIGTSDTMLKVAHMVEGIRISYIKKSNGASTNYSKSFEDFVLMDEFFEMYGNKY